MKWASFLGSLLLVAPLALVAQSASLGAARVESAGPDGQMTLHRAHPAAAHSCPVSIQASHLLAEGSMIKSDAAHPTGIGQRLRLTFTDSNTRTIAHATLLVRGWTVQGRIAEAARNADAGLAARTITVPVAAGTADLWAPGLTAIDSVQLLSMAYVDGSEWTPAAGQSCQAALDLFMPIRR